MNALRRILLAVLSVALLAACGGLFALAWNQEKKLDIRIGDFNLQAFIVASDGARALFGLLLAAVALVGFLALLAAVWRTGPARSRGMLSLRQQDGGVVELPAATLEGILRDALNAMPEVRRAEPRVDLRSGSVTSHIEAVIQPSVSIAHATKAIADTIHAVLREQVGVTSVARPTIRISYDELAARPAGAVPPRASAPPQPPPPAPIFPAAREPEPPRWDDPPVQRNE